MEHSTSKQIEALKQEVSRSLKSLEEKLSQSLILLSRLRDYAGKEVPPELLIEVDVLLDFYINGKWKV